jgi:tetratricopeptide (TPR) repeat protein
MTASTPRTPSSGAHAGGAGTDPAPRRGEWLAFPLLIVLVLAAYHPVWRAGFIWDDDAHVTRPGLRSLHGLWRIWFDPGATQQYYPALHSAFWIEHRLWGDAPAWYHVANVVLHGCVACLLFRVLRRLVVPGAFLAAALFAVHPVCVESVAWVSEQKNTISAVFCLGAALAYLRYDRGRSPGWYAAGTALFLLALLSKSVAATLPAALLVIAWWRHGRVSWRGDVLPLAPWLALGAGAGAMTSWMERAHVGANGAAFALGVADRFLVAGRALWFYLGKILWPSNLTFIYPRWSIDARDPSQYIFPAAAAAVLAGLWLARGRTRSPLAAALLFAGTLFPALGFINVFPFIYSFVADHFQYMAAAVVLSAAGAAFAMAARLLPAAGRTAAWAAAACIVAILASLTWRQGAMYADAETLWRATIARNPSCWMAYNNLAADLLRDGSVDDAISDARRAIELDPADAEAHVTLGEALLKKGFKAEGLAQYDQALQIEPGNPIAHNNLGNVLLKEGRVDEAIIHYRAALKSRPDSPKAHGNLGEAYLLKGRLDEAVAQLDEALASDPLDAGANANLGIALAQEGHVDAAISQFRRALDIDPGFFIAHTNLGNALLQSGRTDEAIAQYAKALELEPNSPSAHNNLGYGLLQAGRLDEAIAQFRAALSIDPGNAGASRNLAEALSRR